MTHCPLKMNLCSVSGIFCRVMQVVKGHILPQATINCRAFSMGLELLKVRKKAGYGL